jgi:uncharacterized protein
MRSNRIFGLLIVVAILFLIELVAYQTFNSWVKLLKSPSSRIVWWMYIILTACLWIFMFSFPAIRNWNGNREVKAIVSIVLFGFLLAKLIVVLIGSLDYIKRGIAFVISKFYGQEAVPQIIQNGMSRSGFIRNAALLVGGSAYGIILSGASNRYNYKVHHVKVPIPNLPDALKRLKIIQISDIHSGSFTSVEAVTKGIEAINALQPDIIFFTGDLVNNEASEMKNYIDVFKQLKAKYGVFSTLGNHDYGDYLEWSSGAAKEQNLQDLKNIHSQMGWRLMLNENLVLDIEGYQLGIVGVENISGSRGFHTYGDLDKALVNLPVDTACNILLSHDPSHWDKQVKGNVTNLNLTLSGHTHGMQFGLDLSWIKWSPVQYIYPQWAGLYKEANQFLYVNRGFGFLGYPGRVGILPEITCLTLG